MDEEMIAGEAEAGGEPDPEQVDLETDAAVQHALGESVPVLALPVIAPEAVAEPPD